MLVTLTHMAPKQSLPYCSICSKLGWYRGVSHHDTKEHPCGVCRGTGHGPWIHCNICGSTTHSTKNHKCDFCEEAHATAHHICSYCQIEGHERVHHQCYYCPAAHLTEDHKCRTCGGNHDERVGHPGYPKYWPNFLQELKRVLGESKLPFVLVTIVLSYVDTRNPHALCEYCGKMGVETNAEVHTKHCDNCHGCGHYSYTLIGERHCLARPPGYVAQARPHRGGD